MLWTESTQSFTNHISAMGTSPGRPPPVTSPDCNARSARASSANSSQLIASVNTCRKCVVTNQVPTTSTAAIAQCGMGVSAMYGRFCVTDITYP
jgi:hypothetical protein